MKAYGVGRLTKDIEVKMTTNGKKVTSFTLASSRIGNKDVADFVSCVAWERTAELLAAYCHKGSRIFVEGDVQTRNYDDPNYTGRKVNVTEVVVNRIEFLDSKPKEETSQEAEFETDFIQTNGSLDLDENDDLPF